MASAAPVTHSTTRTLRFQNVMSEPLILNTILNHIDDDLECISTVHSLLLLIKDFRCKELLLDLSYHLRNEITYNKICEVSKQLNDAFHSTEYTNREKVYKVLNICIHHKETLQYRTFDDFRFTMKTKLEQYKNDSEFMNDYKDKLDLLYSICRP